jgi:hypothetical protein
MRMSIPPTFLLLVPLSLALTGGAYIALLAMCAVKSNPRHEDRAVAPAATAC